MIPTLRTQSAGVTDVGRVRAHNEDALLDRPQAQLWAVADGMGGHSAGDYASRCIVESLEQAAAPGAREALADEIEERLWTINADLIRIARERGVPVIGATVVVMMAFDEFMLVGWAGDSRVYRYHGSRLEQITRDHSSVQELLDAGVIDAEGARRHPQANAVTRAVGGDDRLALDWCVARHAPGMQFLLCSDGLTRELDDAAIAAGFAAGLDPAQTAAQLVAAAVQHGGRDNTTAVVVRVQP